MSRKRIVLWAVAAMSAALVCASPLAPLIALFLYVGIYQTLFPATIDWDDKNAYMKCPGAIADPRIWPAPPQQACQAMHLCANEAPLSEDQRKALYAQIGKMPGCQEP